MLGLRFLCGGVDSEKREIPYQFFRAIEGGSSPHEGVFELQYDGLSLVEWVWTDAN